MPDGILQNGTIPPIIDWLLPHLPTLAKVIITLIVSYIIIRIIKRALKRFFKKTEFNETLELFVQKVIGYALWFIVLTFIIGELGLNEIFTTLLAVGALAGMAVALAVNSTLKDVVSGMMLMADRDFNIGYKIETQGKIGKIVDMGIRKTRLQLDDGTKIVFSNAKIDDGGWRVIERTAASKK